jgi:hypothetical protein
MRSKFDDFVERARRRNAENADAAAAMQVVVTVPASLRREWLRGHATAGMAIALAAHAWDARDLPLLDDTEELAATLTDRYDGPHARFVVCLTRGVILRRLQRFAEAMAALDRAAVELDTAPLVFAAPFRADLAMERAALFAEMGDAVAARTQAWSAADWYRATGERAGLRRVARIVTSAAERPST